jgi:transposase
MPDPIPRSIKHDAMIMVADGHKADDIAITLNISISTVKRAKSKLKKHGDVEGGKGKPGAPGKINALMENVSLHVRAF